MVLSLFLTQYEEYPDLGLITDVGDTLVYAKATKNKTTEYLLINSYIKQTDDWKKTDTCVENNKEYFVFRKRERE